MNASDIIFATGRNARWRDHPAIIHGGGVLTYGEFDAVVARTAAAFAALALPRGERVCLLMNDTPLFCAAFLGTLKAGGVVVPLNARLPSADLAFIVRDTAAHFLIADHELLAIAQAACSGTATRVLRADDGDGSLAALSARSAPLSAAAPTAANEPAFWLYSSGTTGKPKAIIHSHANAAHAGKLLREVVQAGEHTVVLGASRLFFAFGLDNAFLGPLSCGATTILNGGWAEPERVAELTARHRPNVFFAVPSFFRRLLALPEARRRVFADVPLQFTAGERLPDAVAAQWRAAIGREIYGVHGMSETFCNTLANRPDRWRLGTCGTPLDGVQTKLLDTEGNAVAHDSPGVLWLKHPSLALGYRNPEATARAFRDGWFCTGDLFTCDADGFWTHHGRADDLIKVAGQWVKPAEVEEAVLTDPRVREAACVVVPDADGFDRLALFVGAADAHDGTQIAAARVQALPRHCQPKWIRSVIELPRTATGKVQRYLLRQQLLEELRDSDINN